MRKILIIEDNDIVRDGFRLLIKSNSEHQVVGAFDRCEAAIDKLDDLKPDIVLMDLDLPGIDGIEGTKAILKHYPETKIVVITVHEESDRVFDALCAGASGYITKDTNQDDLINAIEEVSNGGAPMSSQIARMVVSSFRQHEQSPLTSREQEVLNLLSQGKSYSEIAEELFVHRETVKSHIKNIYEKLHVNNKKEALEVARKNRFLL